MTLQAEIDAIDYPCTHQYNLVPLFPIGHLKKRVECIPDEFLHSGNAYLDIGCNKGYFSLLAMKHCNTVEAIDTVPEYVELCNQLGVDTNLSSFREYNPEKKFDRIMVGNVLHYMYRECGDWSFIIKLAAISDGLVLIEAPTGMECGDMKGIFSKQLEKGFNKDSFMEMMNRFFTLKSISNSPSPDRYIMLFERKTSNPDSFLADIMDVDNLKVLKDGIESTVYRCDSLVYKKQKIHTTVKDEIEIFIACHSPISNGYENFVYLNNFDGWVEKFSDKKVLKYFQKQDEVWQKICEHNVYLARLGYTDIDVATINFFEDLTLFDKGGIRHVSSLLTANIEDIKTGHYFIMLRNSYDIEIDLVPIHKALNSRDSFEIQKVYEGMITKDEIKKSWWRRT